MCPLNGRQGRSHAREHGDLTKDRSGAGDEVAECVATRHIGQDQVVAGSGVDGHQRAADPSMTEAFRGTRPPGITGLATADAKQQASAEERSEIYECWKMRSETNEHCRWFWNRRNARKHSLSAGPPDRETREEILKCIPVRGARVTRSSHPVSGRACQSWTLGFVTLFPSQSRFRVWPGW